MLAYLHLHTLLVNYKQVDVDVHTARAKAAQVSR
jgi:hypothetical protein